MLRRISLLMIFLSVYSLGCHASSLEVVQQNIMDQKWSLATKNILSLAEKMSHDEVVIGRLIDFYKSVPVNYIVSISQVSDEKLIDLRINFISGDDLKKFYISLDFVDKKFKKIKLYGSKSNQIHLNEINDRQSRRSFVSSALDFNLKEQVYSLEVEFTNNEKKKYQWLMTPPKVDNFPHKPLQVKMRKDSVLDVKWNAFKTDMFRSESVIKVFHQVFSDEKQSKIAWASDKYQSFETYPASPEKFEVKASHFVSKDQNREFYFRTNFEEVLKTESVTFFHITRISVPFSLN